MTNDQVCNHFARESKFYRYLYEWAYVCNLCNALKNSVVTTILPFPVERVRARLVCLRACESVPVPACVHERGSAVAFEHTRVHACSNTSVRERVR